MRKGGDAVAFVVSQATGLDTNSAPADYIHPHRGEPKTLTDSLGRIQKAASAILQAITEKQDSPSTPGAGAVSGLAA